METSHAIHLINPVVVELWGPAAIRWYGLAYLAGFAAAFWLLLRWSKQGWLRVAADDIQSLIVYCVVGVMVGGRLGFLLFYDFASWRADPFLVVRIWQGGMASHGGMIGLAVAMFLFARSRQIPLLHVSDAICAASPLGIFFGRLANFVNGELYGRSSEVPWAIYFPTERPEFFPGGAWAAHRYDVEVIHEFIAQGLIVPRHPSQLYAAFVEGLLLFAILAWLRRAGAWKVPGLLSAAFLFFYAWGRIAVEFVREPEIVYWGWLTQGQLLSVGMLVAAIIVWKYSRSAVSGGEGLTDRYPS